MKFSLCNFLKFSVNFMGTADTWFNIIYSYGGSLLMYNFNFTLISNFEIIKKNFYPKRNFSYAQRKIILK